MFFAAFEIMSYFSRVFPTVLKELPLRLLQHSEDYLLYTNEIVWNPLRWQKMNRM